MNFLAEHPAASLMLLRCMASRLRDASRRQVEYGALDAVGRVCRRLVELMDRYGTPMPGEGVAGVRIDAPLTQGDIAAWAGLSREAVVKALHAAAQAGLADDVATGDHRARRARRHRPGGRDLTTG